MKTLDRSWIDELTPEEYEWYFLSSPAKIPQDNRLPWVVDYSYRGPQHHVVSGPLGATGIGRGRWFATAQEALSWAEIEYGFARLLPVCQIPQELIDAGIFTLKRWFILVRSKTGHR